MDHTKHLVIGGGLAGGSAVRVLRVTDPEARIVLVTEESHLPYDRVPLSKQVLMGKLTIDKVFLKDEEFYKQERIEIIRNRRATSVDIHSHLVTFDDGSELEFERLLFATGGSPIRLSIPGNDLPGIYYLRTIEDSEAILSALNSKSALIIGGGFIGCEVAAACISKGLETTIVEAGPRLLGKAIDEETAQWVTDYFKEQGVTVFTNTTASKFIEDEGRVGGVELDGGDRIRSDFVVVGIGVKPNDQLARDAGLQVDNGIAVSENLQASSPGIYAAGDVARFHSPLFGKPLRVEHYDVAFKQGRIAGANMVGAHEAFSDPPYFYSFTPNLKIQVWGDVTDYDQVVRRGSLKAVDDKTRFAQFYLKEGQVQAYLSVNRDFKEAQAGQKLVISRKKLDDLSPLSDETVDLNSLVD